MKKAINVIRGVSFIVMFMSIGMVGSDTKVPLITLAVSLLVLLVTTFINTEEDGYERRTK